LLEPLLNKERKASSAFRPMIRRIWLHIGGSEVDNGSMGVRH